MQVIEKTHAASAGAKRSRVLTTATLKAAEILEINQSRLAQVVGVSAPTISRMKNGEYLLSEERKEWSLAALFVRMFRSLDSMVAGRGEDARAWLNSSNQAFDQRIPAEMIVDVQGLVHVVDYLDAARGNV
jgi:uncharacterized protein (DUF2384 family)